MKFRRCSPKGTLFHQTSNASHDADRVRLIGAFDEIATNLGMEKTIVFCVSQEHALEVRDTLNRLNRDLNVSNYSVRIVSEESDAQALLEKFQAVEKPTPVIATTVDLLSTGVDAPSVRNIVFFKTITSPTVFKQIIGRGSRLCEDTDKYWFRLDYTGATDLFDDWDKPTPPPLAAQQPPVAVCWLGERFLKTPAPQYPMQ